MRRPRFVWTSAFVAVGFSALTAPAQQPQRGQSPAGASSSSAPAVDPGIDPSMAARPARYLLRNGQDYLSYREYDRALAFFRSIEKRQAELSDTERQQLRQGIARAQQGKREAVNGPHVVAQPKGRPTNPPGSFALAQPKSARPAVAVARKLAPEPVQLTSATMPAAEAESTSVVAAVVAEPAPVSAPSPVVASVPSAPAPLDPPVADAPAPIPTTADGMELPTIPAAAPAALPDLGSPPPGSAPLPVAPDPTSLPTVEPVAPVSTPAPLSDPAAPPDLPTLGSAPAASPTVDPATMPAEATPPVAPTAEAAAPVQPESASTPLAESALPTLPESVPAPEPTQDPAQAPAPATAPTPASVLLPMPARVEDPSTIPAQAPVEAPPAAEAPGSIGADPFPASSSAAALGSTPTSESFLNDRHRREIEKLAQRNMDNPANERASAANPTGDPNAPGTLTQGSTRLELLRPPSPTEAQPIRRIPVPEEFVPLAPRDWNPNRKYWAAAGTCHMILYFQDPVLERYGQGVEQALGPRGRFFSYPLDDPKQSNQRNQILQPFWSIGKFCFQVGTLPYKLVVDPPWEAEYDLGYYRPGDKIPPDTLMITPTGIGPPLKGRKY